MDSGTGASGGGRDPARRGRFPRSHSGRPSGPAVPKRRSRKCVLPPEPRFDTAGLQPQLRSWADLPADILSVVAGRLPHFEDRARLRSVCRAWRTAARLHRPPLPPLPLLVFSDFAFASFCTDGAVAGTRRIPLPAGDTAVQDVRCVGSFEGWLVGAALKEGRYFGDARCFLMNAFTRKVIRLLPPSIATHFVDAYSRSLPIVNGSGVVHCTVGAAHYVMSFSKVALSASPESGSKCVVAAVSVHRSTAKLALWRPGMTSWCLCHGSCISKFSDIAWYKGKLFVFNKLATNLFVFEISEDDSGLMVSRVERCATELPEVNSRSGQTWNIVEWHGKLLLLVAYWHNNCKIEVFEVDLSRQPFRLAEVNSLDGNCIFVSPCSSQSFGSSQYDEVEGDGIYFIGSGLSSAKHAPLHKFVYNIRDGTTRPFAAEITEDNLRAPNGMLMNPTWLFPSD